MIRVHIDGVDALGRDLQRLRHNLERMLPESYEDAAEVMAAATAANVPVRTGALRASIDVRRTADGADVSINVPYAYRGRRALVEAAQRTRPRMVNTIQHDVDNVTRRF